MEWEQIPVLGLSLPTCDGLPSLSKPVSRLPKLRECQGGGGVLAFPFPPCHLST